MDGFLPSGFSQSEEYIKLFDLKKPRLCNPPALLFLTPNRNDKALMQTRVPSLTSEEMRGLARPRTTSKFLHSGCFSGELLS